MQTHSPLNFSAPLSKIVCVSIDVHELYVCKCAWRVQNWKQFKFCACVDFFLNEREGFNYNNSKIELVRSTVFKSFKKASKFSPSLPLTFTLFLCNKILYWTPSLILSVKCACGNPFTTTENMEKTETSNKSLNDKNKSKKRNKLKSWKIVFVWFGLIRIRLSFPRELF